MPLFDFKCPDCGTINIDEFLKKYDEVVICRECKSVMDKLVSVRVVADVFPADGVFLEHVSADGKTFKSKSEMRDFQKKNNVELGYLL